MGFNTTGQVSQAASSTLLYFLSKGLQVTPTTSIAPIATDGHHDVECNQPGQR